MTLQALNSWGLSWDDVLLLPELRTLSVVKGVGWPPKVHAYVTSAYAKAGVPTYFEHAI